MRMKIDLERGKFILDAGNVSLSVRTARGNKTATCQPLSRSCRKSGCTHSGGSFLVAGPEPPSIKADKIFYLGLNK